MTFDIPAAGSGPYLTLLGITLLPALLPVLLARRRTLAANLKTMLACVLLILPFTAFLAADVSRNSLQVRDGKVQVKAGYFREYERKLADFDLAGARHGNYAAIDPAQIAWRSNGVGLPGYLAGRFTGEDRSKLFVVMTDRERVVYLPAKGGQSLLVSVKQGEQLLEALRNAQLQLTRRDWPVAQPCPASHAGYRMIPAGWRGMPPFAWEAR
ncbi:hypothetical protein [Massilia consociata]|uniref:Bacterial Pleckstrin homology domain-containing protein n=1 Tax=Massilia consociata TaxID=760117 RepID=A0ABV6FCL7_9BURK